MAVCWRPSEKKSRKENFHHEIKTKIFAFLVRIQIQLFNFSLESRKLVELCQPFIGHVECLNLSVKDDFVAVSDLYCAPTILRYDSQEKKFEKVLWKFFLPSKSDEIFLFSFSKKIASNPHPVWALACAFIDDETILCSTDEAELFCCQKNSESTKENERKVLKRSAFWHLGETINVLKSGRNWMFQE